MSKTNVILIGPMGSGKTTIGRLLARELNRPFFDADSELEKRTGVNIPWIFDVEGEAGFRKRETSIIEKLTEKKNIILATGGGAILKEENRNFIKSRGVVIYLSVSIDSQIERTSQNQNRPLLQVEDIKKQLQKLHQIRHPLYESIADFHIATDKHSINNIVTQCLEYLANENITR